MDTNSIEYQAGLIQQRRYCETKQAIIETTAYLERAKALDPANEDIGLQETRLAGMVAECAAIEKLDSYKAVCAYEAEQAAVVEAERDAAADKALLDEKAALIARLAEIEAALA